MGHLIEHFSTGAIEPRQQLAYWNQIAAGSSSGLSIDGAGPAFTGRLSRWRLGELMLLRPRAEGSVVHRRADKGGEERLLVHVQGRGRSAQSQAGCDAVLRSGDISVCTSALPVRLTATAHEMLVIDLPRRLLDDRVPDLGSRLSRPIRSTSPTAHAFSQFLASIWREGLRGAAELDAEWERGVSDILLDLLAVTLRGASWADPGERPDVQRMRALVETRLEDPDLSAGSLAEDLGVSVRTIQSWFSMLATTPRSYILERRLERAAERLLTDPAESITAIAFDHGFNDSAYFTRCFRQQFGATPTEYRQGSGVGATAH